jgi:hypothetical protein
MAESWSGAMASWLALTATAVLSLASPAFALSTTAFAQTITNTSPEDIHITGKDTAGPPRIVFACDGSTSEIESLFSQPDILPDLKAINAGIALVLPDLSADRAQIVLQLNRAGIPVTAWLALPVEQGYYINAGNAPEAAARFAAFQRWTSTYDLRWAMVGLDIEPNINDFSSLRTSKWHLARTLIGRYFEMERVRRAREAYSSLIRRIQADGYPVETYQFPFIADARQAHSTLLERLAGIVDVRGDREVLMIYTSFRQQLDPALIWVYGPDAQAIAIGSTSGPETSPRFKPLHWEEFSRDLIVASHFTREIGVYNLQGSVQQGFLPRLKTLNWNQSVDISTESIRQATQLRARIQRVLWLVSHLPYLAAVIFLIAITSWILTRRPRRTHLNTSSASQQNPG